MCAKIRIPSGSRQAELHAASLFPPRARLISEKPADNHTVEVSVMEVHNNEVFDLLAKDEQGNAASQRRDVATTSSGCSQVASLIHQ